MPKQRAVFPVAPMAPDLGLYSGASEASDLCKGFVRVSGQPMLIPQFRALPDNAPATMVGAAINGVSNGFDRLFFATDHPGLFEWAVSAADNAITNRTPTVASHMSGSVGHTFIRWGKTFLASPHVQDVGDDLELLQYDPAAGATFERFVTSTEKPVGRFMGRVRNHLIIANCDETGYSPGLGAEGNRFHWSSRLNILDWSDPDKLAGYGYISDRPISNDITGFSVWEDFGVFFTRAGVYRLSFVGGETRFELDGVGEGHETVFGGQVLNVGRNGFYISNSGPRIIINGERTESLGLDRVNRSFMDRSWGASWALSSIMGGSYDRLHSLVSWVYAAEDGVWWILAYELGAGEFSLVELGDGPTNEWVAAASIDDYFKVSTGGDEPPNSKVDKYTPVELETTVLSDHGKPLWNTILVPGATASDWNLFGQCLKLPDATLRRDTYGVEYLSKVQRLGGEPSAIHAVRPIWDLNSAMAAAGVELSIVLEGSEDPHFATANIRSTTLTTASKDARDFMIVGLPQQALFWRVRATIPAQQQVLASGAAISTHYQLKELTAFEVEYTSAGSRA